MPNEDAPIQVLASLFSVKKLKAVFVNWRPQFNTIAFYPSNISDYKSALVEFVSEITMCSKGNLIELSLFSSSI